jgi:hypothetical protein
MRIRFIYTTKSFDQDTIDASSHSYFAVLNYFHVIRKSSITKIISTHRALE